MKEEWHFFFKADIALTGKDTSELGNDGKERVMLAESTDSYSFNRRRAVHLNHSHAPFHCAGFPQCHSHSSLGHVHAVVELSVGI